jgi:hypothetical protein
VAPNWQPKSINTDGWKATRSSLRSLFPGVLLVLCFLHGFLKIRDRCRKDHGLHQRVWDVYRAETEAEFRAGLIELKEWSETQSLREPVQTALEKLFSHADDYASSYTEPEVYRTSNQVDRPMNRLTRSLYASRGIHGHQASSERRLRGLSLLENFDPFAGRPFARRSNTKRNHPSPAHRLGRQGLPRQLAPQPANISFSTGVSSMHIESDSVSDVHSVSQADVARSIC